MSCVIWRPRALGDLQRLFDFLNTKNPQAAAKAARQIRDAGHQLAAYPRIGKPMQDDTGRREFSTGFGKGGYVLRYCLDNEENVVILRVWHFLEDR